MAVVFGRSMGFGPVPAGSRGQCKCTSGPGRYALRVELLWTAASVSSIVSVGADHKSGLRPPSRPEAGVLLGLSTGQKMVDNS